jgi:hypothetical protein
LGLDRRSKPEQNLRQAQQRCHLLTAMAHFDNSKGINHQIQEISEQI